MIRDRTQALHANSLGTLKKTKAFNGHWIPLAEKEQVALHLNRHVRLQEVIFQIKVSESSTLPRSLIVLRDERNSVIWSILAKTSENMV